MGHLKINWFLETHIFKQQYKKYPWTMHNFSLEKNNKRNAVWKHPCYLVSKYKTSTNNLLQNSKKSVLCFLFVFYFPSFFSKTSKISPQGWMAWMTVFHHFICWRIHLHASLVDRDPLRSYPPGWAERCLGSLSQGWESLWVVHIRDRHSTDLKDADTRKAAHLSQMTDFKSFG